jgi:hypothetical protein
MFRLAALRGALVAGGLAVGLVAAEGTIRIARPTEIHVFDPEIGWTPRPGFSAVTPEDGRVTIDVRGCRSNGPRSLAGPVDVLAVGDSYVYGSQVDDWNTWPAQLERRLGRRVLNAGVNAYGLDQAILRAERLMPELHPKRVIVGIIPNDIIRCGADVSSGRSKAWFREDGSGFVLMPPHREPSELRRLALLAANGGGGYFHATGTDLARLSAYLAERIAALPSPLLVVYWNRDERDGSQVEPLIRASSERGVPLLFMPEMRARADLFVAQGWHHFSPRGNAYVAEAIATRSR